MANNSKVIYVEPNLANDYTTYKSTNIGDVYKSISQEDLCIVVGLDVEIKGRSSIMGQGNDENKIISFNWQSGANGEKASFTEGSKIYTNKDRDEYIKALTTNYTDCNLFGVKETGSAELFGIKSIDISYTNFMVPEVTIQFVDVRGVSLFVQEEMRHNTIKEGVPSSANRDIEGSFFKSFFTFPYPKFTLRVKGFYGEMVSYELTCSDFRAAFESTTGNFNVTAKFVGYAFSFLTDVMVNCLTAAPYSEYLGKEYWLHHRDVTRRFTVEGLNGAKNIPMLTLSELCKAYDSIKKQAAQILEEKSTTQILQEAGASKEEIETVSGDTANQVITNYNGLISKLESLEVQLKDVNNKNGSCCIRAGNSFAFILDDNDRKEDDEIEKGLESLKKDFESLNSELKSYASEFDNKTQNIIYNHYFSILEFNDYDDIIVNKGSPQIQQDKITEERLRLAIEEKASQQIKGQNGRTYYDAWYDGTFSDSSEVYVYQDFGLGELLPKEQNARINKKKELNNVVKKAEEYVLAKVASNVFNFPPTVENITKIIMAHVETFIYMVSQCSKNIISRGAQRRAGNLGIKFNQYADINWNGGVDENTIIPPFPKVTAITMQNGLKKEEEEWIGNIAGVTRDNFEEIKLVEGILNGVEQVKSDLTSGWNEEFNAEENMTGNTIKHALAYFDLFLKDGETPFGKKDDVNISDINEIFARMCVRAFSIFATQDATELNPSTYGMADAENFIDYFGKEELTQNIGNLIDSVTRDKIISYFLDKKEKIDNSKTGDPWRNNKSLLNKFQDFEYSLVLGNFGRKGQVFPVKDWNFNVFNFGVKDNAPNAKNFTNCVVTPCFNNDKEDVVSISIAISEGNANHFKSLYYNSNSTDVGKNNKISETIFKERDIIFEGWGNGYAYLKNRNDQTFIFDKNGKQAKIDVIRYDDNGNVINGGEYSINFGRIFRDKEYMDINDLTSRAVEFVLWTFPESGVDRRRDFFKTTNKPLFRYCPKFELLKEGARIIKGGGPNKENRVRRSISKFYVDYFNEWVDTIYKDVIEPNFKFELKPGVSYANFDEQLHNNRKNVEGTLKVIKNNVKDDSTFQKINNVYAITVEGGNVYIKTKPSKAMSSIIEDCLKSVAVCTVSKFNGTKGSYDNDSKLSVQLVKSKINGYFDGVLEVFKRKLKETQNEPRNVNVSTNNDPEDIKHGVYSYIKLLYDKWLASGDQDNFYRMEKMFEGDNPTFHFIDSAYNKIGKSLYLNLSTLIGSVVKSQTAAGYSLLSLFSNLYATNKFNFLCIQNFLDLSDPDAMNRMFKPLSYNDYREPSNHPNFIVMMPYEPSSKLDVEGADYANDTFYLNMDESTLPQLIQLKRENDLPIPAFGVSYGQQYQNYFKDVQVDMNSPMSTEQSIKAKFMIAGAYRTQGDTGQSVITYGQDLYSIYSNNSYTCTVTMMGCAWVQPMMYFVLMNIPMFHGSYWIVKVNHQIRPGFMTTTFKGVRMSKNPTRAVKQYILGLSNDSIGRPNETQNIPPESEYADITNDCPYAYYSPIPVNTKILTESDKQAYCYSTYQALIKSQDNGGAGLTDAQARGICANIMAESGFDPYMCTIDGNGKTGAEERHGVGGGLASFYYHGKAQELYRFVYGNAGIELLNELNNAVEPVWQENPRRCDPNNQKKLSEMGIKFTVEFEDQVRFIIDYTKKPPCNGIRNKATANEATEFWKKVFEVTSDTKNRWSMYKDWVNSAIAAERKINKDNGTEITKKDNNEKKRTRLLSATRLVRISSSLNVSGQNDGVTISEIANGLVKSLEASLKMNSKYKNVEVTMIGLQNDYYEYKLRGNSNSDVLFDCMLNTYSQWFDKIEWNVGDTKINGHAQSVKIHVVKSKPSSTIITITGDGGNEGVTYTCSNIGDVNNSLAISLAKKFANDKVSRAEEVKSSFRSGQGISDERVEEDLLQKWKRQEREKLENKNVKYADLLVKPCDSVTGKTAKCDTNTKNCTEGMCCKPFSRCYGTPTPGPYIKNNDSYNIANAVQYVTSHSHSGSGDCAKYVRSAIDYGFGTNPNGANSYTEKAGRPIWAWCYIDFLPRIGFRFIGTSVQGSTDFEPTSFSLQTGDIAVYQEGDDQNKIGHICMWTGSRWISDFVQDGVMVYHRPNRIPPSQAYFFRFEA